MNLSARIVYSTLHPMRWNMLHAAVHTHAGEAAACPVANNTSDSECQVPTIKFRHHKSGCYLGAQLEIEAAQPHQLGLVRQRHNSVGGTHI